MKNNFRIFFSTFRKITVGGFVNQLIKKFWPYYISFHAMDMMEYRFHGSVEAN